MFVVLPRKVYTMLPRGILARFEPNRSGSLSLGKRISMCCALSVETVLCLRNSVHQQPHAAAALRCWTRTRTSLPCTNSWARQPRAMDTQPYSGSILFRFSVRRPYRRGSRVFQENIMIVCWNRLRLFPSTCFIIHSQIVYCLTLHNFKSCKSPLLS
jgi:hypothetical protein